MLVTLDEDNRIVSIDGDPENPATGGHVCLKGLAYARRVTYPNRLLTPLRRRASGAGFEPVGWDDALGEITERLSRVRTAHGPEAALYYEGSGSHGALGGLAMAFWRQFGGCTTTFGDLCWPAGLEATRLTYGDNRHNHPKLTTESRMVLLWGHNPAETNIHQWRLILDAQGQGARVVVIDPRQTDSTDAADVHLQPRPGTDAALALGMASVIVDDGLHDSAFLDAHAHGFDEYRQRLADFPLERAASITGLEPEAIRALARDYARTKPALLIAGFGLQRHSRAGQTMRAVALLPALTGNVGRGGRRLAVRQSRQPLPATAPPAAGTGRRRDRSPCRRWRGISRRSTVRRFARRGSSAAIRPRRTRRRIASATALARLDLVVVVDQFMTPTAELAHFVLPAKTLFEEEDLVTAYWHPYLQWRAKVLAPPGEVRPETEIWRAMCAALRVSTRATSPPTARRSCRRCCRRAARSRWMT